MSHYKLGKICLMPLDGSSQQYDENKLNVATRKTPAGSIPASPANLGIGAEGYLPPLRLLLYPGWLDLLEDDPRQRDLSSFVRLLVCGAVFNLGTFGPLCFPLLGRLGPGGCISSFLLFWCCERLRLFGKIGPGQLGA